MICKWPFLAAALLVFIPGTTIAQQSHGQVNELALEIVYLKGTPPSYLPVPYSFNPEGGAWYARFGKIAGWQLPSGQLPVRAVRFVPSVVGEVVRIRVSVLRGVRFFDTEDVVNTYTARENETISIEGLKRFGVEPFVIKVVRAGLLGVNLPTIVNGTKSIEVIGIEPQISSLPSYKIILHNLSDRNISALKVNFLEGGKTVAGGMPQGSDGEPLINAAGYCELSEPILTRAEPAAVGYTPTMPPAQQLAIAAVIFEDGTYEGDVGAAMMYRGFVVGRKIELKRVVALLESALEDSDSPDAPDKLRSSLLSLSLEIDEADFVSLVQAFPTLNKQALKSPVDIAIHGVKKDILDALTAFQAPGSRKPDFRTWLNAVKNRYGNWLSRLTKAETNSQR